MFNLKLSTLTTLAMLLMICACTGMEKVKNLDDYQAMDRVGDKIDCDKMMAVKAHLYEYEQKAEYTFVQCRDAIADEKQQRCEGVIYYHLNGWSSKENPELEINMCKTEIETYFATINSPYELVGNTLRANGMVFHKQGLVLQAIRQQKLFIDNVIYSFEINSGKTSTTLNFNSANRANLAHEAIALFLST